MVFFSFNIQKFRYLILQYLENNLCYELFIIYEYFFEINCASLYKINVPRKNVLMVEIIILFSDLTTYYLRYISFIFKEDAF